MRLAVVLRMPFAPERRSTRDLSNRETIGAGGLDLLPRGNDAGSVGQHGARRVADQTLGNRAKQQARNALLSSRADDNQVSADVVGDLRDLSARRAQSNMARDPRATCAKRSDPLL